MARIFLPGFWNSFRYQENIIKTISPDLRNFNQKRSPYWKWFRHLYLIDHPICASCGRRWNLEVHHIQSINDHPELELIASNFNTLCDDPDSRFRCHLNIGHSGNFRTINTNCRADAAAHLLKLKPWHE
jgi:hypothetical protein